MRDEITYPFPNLNGAAVEVWNREVILSFTLLGMCLLTMLRLKVIHVCERGPILLSVISLYILEVEIYSLACQHYHVLCSGKKSGFEAYMIYIELLHETGDALEINVANNIESNKMTM